MFVSKCWMIQDPDPYKIACISSATVDVSPALDLLCIFSTLRSKLEVKVVVKSNFKPSLLAQKIEVGSD